MKIYTNIYKLISVSLDGKEVLTFYKERKIGVPLSLSLTTPNVPIFLLVLPDFDGFSTPQYSPANRACSHVYQIHQTPPAAFVGFRTVSSQAMDALHLPLYQFHQSPTIGVPFYCMLMDFGGFWMVSGQNV